MNNPFSLTSQGLVKSQELADWGDCTVKTINSNLTSAGVGWVPFCGKNRLWSIEHIREVIATRRNLFHDDEPEDESED